MRRPPKILFWCFHNIIWHKNRKGKSLYITFDDGPNPDTTPWILSTLDAHNAQASFFCLGENALKYPKLINELQARGHTIGNHGFHHLNGWKTPARKYLQNVEQASAHLKTSSLRPPYGKLKPLQYLRLKQRYQIVMWDILTEDYQQNIDLESEAIKILRHLRNGSILVFHDSPKAFENMKYLLSATLQYGAVKGYSFLPI